MAPPGELRVNAGVVLLAGNTVWSTSERLRGEVLMTRCYTNWCLPLPIAQNLYGAIYKQNSANGAWQLKIEKSME